MNSTPQFLLTSLALSLAFLGSGPIASAQVELDSVTVASGLSQPLLVTHAPGDTDRIFIVEQRGTVRVVKNGTMLGTYFLDVQALNSSGGERGLLGMAFHPDYDNNGWVFVNYTNNGGSTVVARYTVSANPDVVNSNSAQIIMTISQPYSNHNGGDIRFGPDGYLYIGTGDGGSAGDPGNRAQNGNSLLGKMLRIDVDNGLPYTIPASNPFVGNPSVRDEIWALGLRNPWRFNFDSETGDMYIADVGQNQLEYIHVEDAGSPGGLNYGWRIIEGTDCYNPSSGCNTTGLEMPIYEYDHRFFPTFRNCIIGSEVYRGRTMATMQGRYFFTDAGSRELWSLRYDGAGGYTAFTDHTAQSGVTGSGRSLGIDADGEVYVCGNNTVSKLVPAGLWLDVPHLFTGVSDSLLVHNATPNSPVYLAYSFVGLGSTPVAALGVTVRMANAIYAMTTTSNGSGEASFGVVPPGALFNRTIYLEAVQNGRVSNVVEEFVE
ncbi:MAG: PQQ-dependent sugar dehydrogenase [Planctomycetota bacterium]|nr:PQQ-dependent sugar dehydrogenase [Planctomycetota bacterium]